MLDSKQLTNISPDLAPEPDAHASRSPQPCIYNNAKAITGESVPFPYVSNRTLFCTARALYLFVRSNVLSPTTFVASFYNVDFSRPWKSVSVCHLGVSKSCDPHGARVVS